MAASRQKPNPSSASSTIKGISRCFTPGVGGDDHRALFQANGLRCTKQRELVFQALASTDTHPTAEELFRDISSGPESLSLATVYNTLEALTQAGLCRRISCADGRGPCRFDADVTGHAHAVTLDGRVVDLPRDLSDRLMAGVPEALLTEIGLRLGMRADEVSIQVTVRDLDPA